MAVSRWTTITPWAYSDERDAADAIREALPDVAPFRAWANFTFVADSGHLHRIDLLVAAPGGLFVVELDALHGRVTNRGPVWVISAGLTRVARDSPARVAAIKAHALGQALSRAAASSGLPMPPVFGVVQLTFPAAEIDLDPAEAAAVYGPDKPGTDRPWLVRDLLARTPVDPSHVLPDCLSEAVAGLLARIGAAPSQLNHPVGTWRVVEPPLEVAPNAQDHIAWSTVLDKISVRARVFVARPDQPVEQRARLDESVLREYLLLSELDHPDIARPETIGHHVAGPALLYKHDRRGIRFDHYLAVYGDRLGRPAADDMITRLGDALAYAHGRGAYHLDLSVRALTATPHPDHFGELDDGWLDPRVRITDWRRAGQVGGEPARYGIDPVAADMLGLGVVALAARTGRPAEGDAAGLVTAYLAGGGPVRLDPNHRIGDLVDRLLSTKDAAEIRPAIEAFLRPDPRVSEALSA
ncbi:Nuclease-related domain-containing protein [Micromonospora pattaloongensis]|uniref:Nuclease-related domain-containing protein n=1 Tax=Micromonospora pattaloongensis TaxID=405436 RepID=A0A1H3JV97_9ACTN|nr:NERD domain-containing protein [Micromonospora pattaloongensis]SDY43174.1 Nuclease-related domain-containing protein [Micromonospora pattaloongensis]